MNKAKKYASKIRRALGLASNPVIVIASTSSVAAVPTGTLTESDHFQPGRTDVALDASIASFKAIKEIAGVVPNIGASLKATCGVMILVLENIKRCKENRHGWRELAEIMQDKNYLVIRLLGLYAQAPEKYADALEQANQYQKILNGIARDMRKETDIGPERESGLERYWETMRHLGSEAALSRINAERIVRYKERIRDQTLNTTAVVGVQIISDLNQIRKLLMEHIQAKSAPSCKVMLQPRPPLVDGFVGRSDILEAMRHIHFDDASTHQSMPRVTVLTGLGGSGKTQIALKFASEFEGRYPDDPIYFLDASSQVSLENDLKILVASQSDVHTDALIWLASVPRNWLIIMDNADDPSLELAQFVPRCTHGHIIVTTRNHLRKVLAPETNHHVESLPLVDSVVLLLKTSRYEDNEINRQLSEKIAQELGCLPLALAHAGAYIFSRQCLDTYLDSYRDSQTRLLRRKFDMLHDYPYSVATTIEMSFKRLSVPVQGLLGLLCHLDGRSIPHSIIEKGACQRFRHVAKETELPLRNWSSFEFDNLIEECEKYSLVQFTKQNGEKFYSIHILVQSFLRTICVGVNGHSSHRLAARLLGSAITVGTRWEYIAFNRLVSSHLRLLDLDDVTEAGDHYGFGYVLEEVGEGQLAVNHMERCLKISKDCFDEEPEFVLGAVGILAQSYSTIGKEEKALEIREDIRKKRQETQGEGHLETLEAISNLAISYSKLGRDEKALPLFEEVMEKRRLLGDNELNILRAVANVATSYSNLGRDKEALPLRGEVVEKWRRLLGDDHLNTLLAVSNLAISYSNLGREEEALQLREELVEKWRRSLGDNHLNTLMAVNNLAASYSNLGREEEALPLREEVMKKWGRLLGDDHLDTLAAVNNLALTYSKLGREEEALPLKEEVVEKWRKLLGGNHIKSLIAVNNLAASYLKVGRTKEAMSLAEDVVKEWTDRLGEDHPNTLSARETLANVYAELGRHDDALKLRTFIASKNSN
ncbi:TPR-like protein [Serendipita vermifera]|nr:TPR-like protein [Serendipita vermifera]